MFSLLRHIASYYVMEIPSIPLQHDNYISVALLLNVRYEIRVERRN